MSDDLSDSDLTATPKLSHRPVAPPPPIPTPDDSSEEGNQSPPISPYSPIFKRKSQDEAVQLQRLFEQIFELNSVIRSVVVNIENEETSTNESIRILREEVYGQSPDPPEARFVVIRPTDDSDKKLGENKSLLKSPQLPRRTSRVHRRFLQWTSPFWVALVLGALVILLALAVLGLGVALKTQGECEDSFHGNVSQSYQS